jgi:hypothetical protein
VVLTLPSQSVQSGPTTTRRGNGNEKSTWIHETFRSHRMDEVMRLPGWPCAEESRRTPARWSMWQMWLTRVPNHPAAERGGLLGAFLCPARSESCRRSLRWRSSELRAPCPDHHRCLHPLNQVRCSLKKLDRFHDSIIIEICNYQEPPDRVGRTLSGAHGTIYHSAAPLPDRSVQYGDNE